MKTVCDINMCNGCSACVSICPRKAITILEDINEYNAVIDENLCCSCWQCHKVCPNNYKPVGHETIEWKQGWSNDEVTRRASASGGVATEIMRTFIDHYNGVVCSCMYRDGRFGFELAFNKDEVCNYRGSKYVKSNPGDIYEVLKDMLAKKNKVLFIGLPCQVAALKNYVRKYIDYLYTVELICHGTPSQILLDKYLKEKKIDKSNLTSISFRNKEIFSIETTFRKNRFLPIDAYSAAFVFGFSYTENCYDCKFANKARIADITLGDSWGSRLNAQERMKGISLILIQTQKGKEIIDNCNNIHLEAVDPKNAIEHNHNINLPSVRPAKRELFFKRIKSGKSITSSVTLLLPLVMIKQRVKYIIMNAKTKHGMI